MNNIKKARENAGLSQKEVAITLGVSAPTVSEWESGKKNPSISYVKQMAKIYAVSSDYLLGLVDSLAYYHRTPEDWMTTDALIKALPEEFQNIILAYRSATPDDRAIIDNIVRRYTHEAKTAHAG